MSPNRPPRPDRSTPPRKGPPPETTGLESAWFDAQAESGNSIVVHLDDGATLRGTVVAHREGLLELRQDASEPNGETVSIRVDRIRLVEGP